MSAEERLLPEVICTSPEGNEHTGKWQSSSDPQTKSQAQFKTVGGNYGRVQDLGTDLRTMNFTIFFEGENHDLDAEAFIASLEESGAWTIDHPVRGRLLNQHPLGFTPANDPIRSGNITAVETSWVTDYPEDNPQSQIQRANEITSAVDDLNEAASSNFFDDVLTTTFNLQDAIRTAVTGVQDTINATLGPLFATINGGQDLMNTLSRGIDQTIDNIVGQPLELASQIQTFCQTPAAILSNTGGRINAYGTAITSLISEVLTGTPEEQKNLAASVQMTTLATFAGLALSAIGNPDIVTRVQAIETSTLIYNKFIELSTSLDEYSENFTGMLYHKKYFSQTDTFETLSILVGKVQAYLLELAISLKKEKRVILTQPMSAIFACLTYYDDCNETVFDLFVKTNNLTLSEIMVIPAGREIVVYV